MQGDILKDTVRALSYQQVEETKKLFNNLLTTSKNLNLYPENHSICRQSIQQSHARLETYLHKFGDVTLEIERYKILCQGVEVHNGPLEEGTLTHILFRDGIGWLQITEGVALEELRQFFSIIHHYSVLTAEPQGDIVTDFWEARFDHIQYQADDFFSENVSEQLENMVSSESTPSPPASEIETGTEKKTKPFTFEGIDLEPAAFETTPREEIILQEMVTLEESSSAIEHLNMLLDLLLQYEEKKDFMVVLEVLSDEYQGSFVRHDFESALIILDGVRKVQESKRLGAPWAAELLETFYHEICSDADSLKHIQDVWNTLNVQQVENLRQIFHHLNPRVVTALANLLSLEQPNLLENILEDTIFSMIGRNPECLTPLINDADSIVVEKLIPIVSRLETDLALKYLMKFARHASASIRRKAMRVILDKVGFDKIAMIFDFIDDKDASIGRMILAQMGKFRSLISEGFLLKYLENKKFSDTEGEHIAECLKTLGKCGSAKSVPLLSKALMNIDWMSGSKNSVYHEAAAQALLNLEIPEAQQIIKKASRSLRPGLRRVARDAEKGLLDRNKGGR